MQVTVDIPDETAARMLGDEKDAAWALLELAGYTACVNGRISEYEFRKVLHLDTRFELHALMKRLRLEEEALSLKIMRQELAGIAKMDDLRKTSNQT